MVTVRSLYGFNQFEKVFQKLAHEIAIAAVTNLNQGRCEIKISSTNKFTSVQTDKYTIVIYSNRIGYLETRQGKDAEYWGFDLEEKLYATSNHRTKLSYAVSVGGHLEGTRYVEDNRKAKEKKRGEEILKFIEQLMTASAMKPEPRFSLAEMVQDKSRVKAA